MSGTEKGVVYLNQHYCRSLIKLNEVKKFCDGTMMKIQENLIDMVIKNKLGQGNIRLKGRDWNDKDIKRSIEMLDKIDQVMKRQEQLRRFEEYVSRRPKTIDPRFYHLEEIHVTWAQFGKKRDKNATLHEFDQEMTYSFVIVAFERHLEEIHVTWAQFGKKRDKNATLHEFDQVMAYSAWRRHHNFL
ncbi:hypothetical protein Tco_0595725 [Tanacetum coccineum]